METITYTRAVFRAKMLDELGVREDNIHSEFWDDDGALTVNVKDFDLTNVCPVCGRVNAHG